MNEPRVPKLQDVEVVHCKRCGISFGSLNEYSDHVWSVHPLQDLMRHEDADLYTLPEGIANEFGVAQEVVCADSVFNNHAKTFLAGVFSQHCRGASEEEGGWQDQWTGTRHDENYGETSVDPLQRSGDAECLRNGLVQLQGRTSDRCDAGTASPRFLAGSGDSQLRGRERCTAIDASACVEWTGSESGGVDGTDGRWSQLAGSKSQAHSSGVSSSAGQVRRFCIELRSSGLQERHSTWERQWQGDLFNCSRNRFLELVLAHAESVIPLMRHFKVVLKKGQAPKGGLDRDFNKFVNS